MTRMSRILPRLVAYVRILYFVGRIDDLPLLIFSRGRLSFLVI